MSLCTLWWGSLHFGSQHPFHETHTPASSVYVCFLRLRRGVCLNEAHLFCFWNCTPRADFYGNVATWMFWMGLPGRLMGNRTYNWRIVAVSTRNAEERTIHARRRRSFFWNAYSKTLCIPMSFGLPIGETYFFKKYEKVHSEIINRNLGADIIHPLGLLFWARTTEVFFVVYYEGSYVRCLFFSWCIHVFQSERLITCMDLKVKLREFYHLCLKSEITRPPTSDFLPVQNSHVVANLSLNST